MKIIFYMYAVLFLYKTPGRCASTEIIRTTISKPDYPAVETYCNVYSGHNADKNVSETMTLNASNCGLTTFKGLACPLCSQTPNMSDNVSQKTIRMLDEVECNCPGITEIDFSNNDLAVLPANSFIFAQYVRRIYIAGNHIYYLEESVFDGLQMLELLDLSRNALRGIQLNVLNNLSNLRTLNLSVNKIQSIVSDWFTGLENLEVLDLSRNNIYSLGSKSFKAMKNLKFLNLSKNKLWSSKLDFLLPFLNLSVANLRGNNFTSFGYGSLNGFHIQELILSELKALRYILAGSFRNSDCLTKLDLSRNKQLIFIEDFAFQNMPFFTEFNVSFTKLRTLPIISDEVQVTAIGTPLQCRCLSTYSICSNYSHSNAGQLLHGFEPEIVSEIANNYFLYIGQVLRLDCFAVGFSKPRIVWERIHTFPNGTISDEEVLAEGYFLNLHVTSLNMDGKYRCEAESNGSKVHKYFTLNVKHINVGVSVLSRNAHSVLVAWNKTIQTQGHVLLHRAFETTSNYVIQRLNEYWKVFILRSLQPFTEYEICIASFLDINDRSCVRTMTSRKEKTTAGIRHNNLAIAFLAISGIIFGAFVVTTIYKCIHKVRIITRQNVFIVGSESRECFADVTESTFTYENQHTDLFIDKTEL